MVVPACEHGNDVQKAPLLLESLAKCKTVESVSRPWAVMPRQSPCHDALARRTHRTNFAAQSPCNPRISERYYECNGPATLPTSGPVGEPSKERITDVEDIRS